jgi:hypothetical protein
MIVLLGRKVERKRGREEENEKRKINIKRGKGVLFRIPSGNLKLKHI